MEHQHGWLPVSLLYLNLCLCRTPLGVLWKQGKRIIGEHTARKGMRMAGSGYIPLPRSHGALSSDQCRDVDGPRGPYLGLLPRQGNLHVGNWKGNISFLLGFRVAWCKLRVLRRPE